MQYIKRNPKDSSPFFFPGSSEKHVYALTGQVAFSNVPGISSDRIQSGKNIKSRELFFIFDM